MLRIAGVKRVERKIMKYLREAVGSNACIVGKIIKSHIVRDYRKDLSQRNKEVAVNEKDHT